jgi:hypothetical protein
MKTEKKLPKPSHFIFCFAQTLQTDSRVESCETLVNVKKEHANEKATLIKHCMTIKLNKKRKENFTRRSKKSFSTKVVKHTPTTFRQNFLSLSDLKNKFKCHF